MIKVSEITSGLARSIDIALKRVDESALCLLRKAEKAETNEHAKWALEQIIKNDEIAEETNSYPCQDTGVAMLFVKVGQDETFDGDLEAALQAAVKIGYTEARKSIADPLTRINTHDNCPAVIYYEIVSGKGLKVEYLAKGAGSENMGGIKMLTPSKGRAGIIKAVTDIVKEAGANPCPPIFLGIGIGGTMDKAAVLSKKALIRKCGERSKRADVAELEKDILAAVNELNIGVQGFGGKHTALECAVEVYPTHIGMLPVAVTIQCHSVRHTVIEFGE